MRSQIQLSELNNVFADYTTHYQEPLPPSSEVGWDEPCAPPKTWCCEECIVRLVARQLLEEN